MKRRARGLRILLAVLIFAGCSGATVQEPLGIVDATPRATPVLPVVSTPEPAADDPVPESTPKPLPVKVTARSKSVRRNGTASVTIKTTPKASCSIYVEYMSGYSTAHGLDDKTATTTGSVTWKWKVGSNTTKGTWPITIECERGDRSGTVETTFTVK